MKLFLSYISPLKFFITFIFITKDIFILANYGLFFLN